MKAITRTFADVTLIALLFFCVSCMNSVNQQSKYLSTVKEQPIEQIGIKHPFKKMTIKQSIPPKITQKSLFSWQTIDGPANSRHYSEIWIDPENEHTWYLVAHRTLNAQGSLFVTRDRGASWTAIPGLSSFYFHIEFDPSARNRMYVATAQSLYRSDDDLNSLVNLRVPLEDEYIRSILVSKHTGQIIVATQKQTGLQGIHFSTNAGSTWRFRSYNLPRAGFIPWDIAEDPVDGTLYIGMEIFDHPRPYNPPFLRSRDNGQTWEDVSGVLPWHVIKIAVHPKTRHVFALTEGAGLYKSTDFGESWVFLNNQFAFGLEMDMRDPRRIYGGEHTALNGPGGVYASHDTAKTFSLAGLSGKATTQPRLNRDGTILYAVNYGEGNKIYRTTLPLIWPELQSPQPTTVMDNGCLDKSDRIIWDFNWSNLAGASRYQIVVKQAGAEKPVIDTVVARSYYRSVQRSYISDKNRDNWFWSVRAGKANGEWGPWAPEKPFQVEYVDTDCGVLRPPVLTKPEQDGLLDNGCMDRSDPIDWRFSWSRIKAATRYQLWIKADNLSKPFVNSNVSSSFYRYTQSGYIKDNNTSAWRWKVRAGDVNGQWSPWSEERKFSVEPVDTDCGKLFPPQLVAPVNGGVLDNGCTNMSNPIEWLFSWDPVINAAQYNIQVETSNHFLLVDNSVRVPPFSRTANGFVNDQNRFNFTWKVRTGNTDGDWSDWSETRSFDLEANNTDCP